MKRSKSLSQLGVHNLLLVVIASLSVFALVASIAARRVIDGAEKRVFEFIYSAPYVLSPLVVAITQLGSVWFLLTITLVLLVNRHKKIALRVFLIGSLSYFMVESSKVLVNRPRPEFLLDGVSPREQFVTGQGFPSGHTALITAVGLMLLPYVSKHLRWCVPLVIIAVGLSRIYLGVHAPLDVVGGFLVGLIAAFSYYLGAGLARHPRIITHPTKRKSKLAKTRGRVQN